MSNTLVSMEDMFHLINEAAGTNYNPKIIPAKVAASLAKLTDFAVYNLTRNNNFDSSKAQEELGFKCRPFEETIYDEVRWLKAEGRIS